MYRFFLSMFVALSSVCLHADLNEESPLTTYHVPSTDFFTSLLSQLPKSSQKENCEKIAPVIAELREKGVCVVEGPDKEIRPACVGLQCLVEETFLATSDAFAKADFEIHTTMPSTPCCKLPSEETKETLLASFSDAIRLVTVDGRSASLDQICHAPNATLFLTYTKEGLAKRTESERAALTKYWEPMIHTTCIASQATFPKEVNGATYRFTTPSGETLYFGIQATQALHADGKRFVLHLGTKEQPAVKQWLEKLEDDLASMGRTLFVK